MANQEREENLDQKQSHDLKVSSFTKNNCEILNNSSEQIKENFQQFCNTKTTKSENFNSTTRTSGCGDVQSFYSSYSENSNSNMVFNDVESSNFLDYSNTSSKSERKMAKINYEKDLIRKVNNSNKNLELTTQLAKSLIMLRILGRKAELYLLENVLTEVAQTIGSLCNDDEMMCSGLSVNKNFLGNAVNEEMTRQLNQFSSNYTFTRTIKYIQALKRYENEVFYRRSSISQSRAIMIGEKLLRIASYAEANRLTKLASRCRRKGCLILQNLSLSTIISDTRRLISASTGRINYANLFQLFPSTHSSIRRIFNLQTQISPTQIYALNSINQLMLEDNYQYESLASNYPTSFICSNCYFSEASDECSEIC